MESPANVYKYLVSNPHCSPDLQPVLAPRDVKQIRNAQLLQRQASCLSHDALYNLHEMAYDTSGFMWRMETYPNLIVIYALQDLIEELNRMIQTDLNAPILLSYDTTFCLTCHLFCIVMCYLTLPQLFLQLLLHKLKFECMHDTFMAFINHFWVMLLHPSPLLVMMKEAFVMQSTNT